MNRLVSVGGLCFVAGTPENAANLSDRSDRSDGSDIAGTEGAVLASGTGKRKYRPRGERSRKEQRREAWRRYYREHKTEHLAKVKAWRLANLKKTSAYQRKYRAAHREEIARYNRDYYQANREELSRKAHLAYLRRKERNEALQRMPFCVDPETVKEATSQARTNAKRKA